MNLPQLILLLQLILALLSSHPSPQALQLAQNGVTLAEQSLVVPSAPQPQPASIGIGSPDLSSVSVPQEPSFCPSEQVMNDWNSFAEIFNSGNLFPDNQPREYHLEQATKEIGCMTVDEIDSCQMTEVPNINYCP